MAIKTFNPFNGKEIKSYEEHDEETVRNIFNSVSREQETWKKSIDDRINFIMKEVVPRFRKEKESLAFIMSSEMGKPITQSRAEIDK